MAQLEVERVLCCDLKPWDKNPRKNQEAIEVVAKSIEQYGFNQPILINQENVICCGHTRWLAMKSLNILKIPCVRKHMTETEFTAYALADNKTGEIASWDNKKLKDCMELLDAVNTAMIPGWQELEIDKLFGHDHTENHGAKGDFGDAGVVDDEVDEEALVKKVKFEFNGKEHRIIMSKLRAIKKEYRLRSMPQALLKALENFKTEGKCEVRKSVRK